MLYRFQIELSDIDRGIYQSLDFRVMQHPSESLSYLLTRVIAYCLSHEESLEFSPSGLSDPETPALWLKSATGTIELWIEIGNPSPKKLHKASKTAKKVQVYTYKNAMALLDEIKSHDIHKAEFIEIFSVDQKILSKIEREVQKNNRWTFLFQQGSLDINVGDKDFQMEITKVKRL